MAEPKNEDFLDDIATAEAEELAEELAEISEEALELDSLRAERDELKDKFMRALADAENARKRGEKARRDAEQYGGSKLARDMLPVYDNMKRALEAATDEQKEVSAALIEGIELTMRALRDVFQKHGIEVISPEVGDKFNPQIAARLLNGFRSWRSLEPQRRRLAKKALQKMAQNSSISRDTTEIVTRILHG